MFSFIFEPEEPLSWQPGQYLHYVLKHKNPDNRGEKRWFTIASAPFERNIIITTRFDGEQISSFKSALFNMKLGDEIEVDDGPKGWFVLTEGEHRHIFIAGGIGITPFRSMVAQLAHNKNAKLIDLMYANKGNNFVFGEELENYQKTNPSFNLLKFVDKRIEQADFKDYLKDKSAIYYLSGPRAMVEAYETLLTEAGVAETAILTDYFPGY